MFVYFFYSVGQVATCPYANSFHFSVTMLNITRYTQQGRRNDRTLLYSIESLIISFIHYMHKPHVGTGRDLSIE